MLEYTCDRCGDYAGEDPDQFDGHGNHKGASFINSHDDRHLCEQCASEWEAIRPIWIEYKGERVKAPMLRGERAKAEFDEFMEHI